MRQRYYFITSVVLCVMLFSISCDDDPSSIDQEAPPVPPTESMEMNFSNFESQSSNKQLQSSNNFGRAAGTALIMKTVVSVNLAIPKVLLKAAQNKEAELKENEEWVWNFSKSAGGTTYSARLVAERTSTDSVEWDLYLTNSNLNLDNHLLFSGVTSPDGTEGTWYYYSLRNTDKKEEVSMVEWAVNGKDDIELSLEVISDRNDRKGYYLNYSFDGTVKTAVFFDNSENEETEIQINVDTKVGYIIAPGYNDGQKSCWDESFQDVPCS